ncbi:Arsb [Symbiodinium necroappetens]|uniref:Arsb protein n=1 Tax=Symbiodinium necroappetens TaxID=1628268 RepID=A0A813BE09_9DINO|nr:Arsb [Symbiodinium necroappetens]
MRQAAMMPLTAFVVAGLSLSAGICQASQEYENNVELLQRKLTLQKFKPHVLLFVADDVGWAGLGAHRTAENSAEAQGKAETQTPVLDNLIRDGVLLERHYAASNSVPSRCSLISGRLPRDFPVAPRGMSNPATYWNPEDNVSGFYGIPRNMTGIGSKLKQAGYATHYVGKWAAGHATPEQTPFGRGFDSFLGFVGNENDYWTKQSDLEEFIADPCLYKFQDFSFYNATYRGGVADTIAAELGCEERVKGKSFDKDGCHEEDPNDCLPESCYEESMLLEYAARLIQNHDSSKPLFLTYASHEVHLPLEITTSALKREEQADAQKERKLPWTKARRVMAASLAFMDSAMGRLIDTLKARSMFEDTLVIFISDNGASLQLTAGGNNYPLKSGKFSEWEGGVRTNAFISGGFIPARHRGSSFHGVIHIADWYATLCSLAGVSHVDDVSAKANELLRLQGRPLLGEVEGRPQLQNIFSGINGRLDVLHLSANAVLKWPYKLVTGQQGDSFWPGPVFPNCSSDGPDGAFVDVYTHMIPIDPPDRNMLEDCGNGCLFDVEVDPSERRDLSSNEAYAAVLSSLQKELKSLNSKTFAADIGESHLEACLQAFQLGGFVGPFVDVGDFYTAQVPGVEELETYRQELMDLHKNLTDPDFVNRTAEALKERVLSQRSTMGSECLEEGRLDY